MKTKKAKRRQPQVRGLNSHPPVQIVAVQQVCGVWAAMIWSQWRSVTDYEGCEWAGPLNEPTEPNAEVCQPEGAKKL